MKKSIVYVLVLSMMLSMMACGTSGENPGGPSSEKNSEIDTEKDTGTVIETESKTELPTESETETETQIPTESETETPSESEPPTEPETQKPSEPSSPEAGDTSQSIKVHTYPAVIGTVRPLELQSHGRDLLTYGDRKIDSELITTLETLLDGYGKNISIAAWRVDGTLALTYNTKQNYFSACTIKTGYMLYCCKQIESGAADAETLLTYQSKHYHGGSGKIKYSSYGTKYSIKYLIEQALCISDNVAFKMLVDYFGKDGYHQMIKDLECESLKMNPTVWSYDVVAEDMIVIWNEVYKFFQTDTEMARLFYNSSLNTPFNYGTETLCEFVDYSHKSGDNFGTYMSYHDAGIIWDKDCPYIFSVYTKSEGRAVDVRTVDSAMELVYQLMTGKPLGGQ